MRLLYQKSDNSLTLVHGLEIRLTSRVDEIVFGERTAKTLTASDRLPESYRINLWYNTNHEKENLC